MLSEVRGHGADFLAGSDRVPRRRFLSGSTGSHGAVAAAAAATCGAPPASAQSSTSAFGEGLQPHFQFQALFQSLPRQQEVSVDGVMQQHAQCQTQRLLQMQQQQQQEQWGLQTQAGLTQPPEQQQSLQTSRQMQPPPQAQVAFPSEERQMALMPDYASRQPACVSLRTCTAVPEYEAGDGDNCQQLGTPGLVPPGLESPHCKIFGELPRYEELCQVFPQQSPGSNHRLLRQPPAVQMPLLAPEQLMPELSGGSPAAYDLHDEAVDCGMPLDGTDMLVAADAHPPHPANVKLHFETVQGAFWLTVRCTTCVSELLRIVSSNLHVEPTLVNLLAGNELLRKGMCVGDLPTSNIQVVMQRPRKVLACTGEGFVRVFNVATEANDEAPRLENLKGGVTAAAWDPDGIKLLVGCDDGTAIVVNSDSNTEEYRTESFMAVNCVAWSADSNRIAAGGGDFKARVFDLKTRKEVHAFEHSLPVLCIAFSPDGARLGTGCGADLARIFDLRNGYEEVRFRHSTSVNSLTWDRNGTRLATASTSCPVRIFNLVLPGEEVVTESADAKCVAWSPAGESRLAVGTKDNMLHLYRTDPLYREAVLEHDGAVAAVCWDPFGSCVVTGCDGGLVRVFNALTGAEEARFNVGRLVSCVVWWPMGVADDSESVGHFQELRRLRDLRQKFGASFLDCKFSEV